MRGYVLDASALLALLDQERGSELIAQFIVEGALMCSVNVAEVVAKLSERGMPVQFIHETLDSVKVMIIDFDKLMAYEAGLLRPLTKKFGLSLGDRACLALAKHLKLPAVTADKAWENLSLDVQVKVIN
jgi:ribonuclease VapC